MKPACSIKNLFLSILLSSAALPFASHAGIVCGDGILSEDQANFPEDCDTGEAATNLCNNNTDPAGGDGPCMFTICGDGITQSPNGVGFDEDCDDSGASTTCSDMCETITPTTTTTTAAPTTTTAAATTTTAAATTTTAAATTTTAAATTTTAAATTTTGAATTTTAAVTTTTGAATTTTAAATTTTAAATTTTAGPTTTTQVPGQCSGPIVIDGTSCRVPDQQVGGQCLSDAIADCDDGRNHGKYVRCVAHVTRDAKRSGDISGKVKGRIDSCAGKSDIGKRSR